MLDPWQTEIAILTCLYAVESVHNPDAAAALAAAVNDWQVAEWLDRDARLRGSLVVPSAIPSIAVSRKRSGSRRPSARPSKAPAITVAVFSSVPRAGTREVKRRTANGKKVARSLITSSVFLFPLASPAPPGPRE